METEQLLEYEIVLLLAKYGEKRVVSAMAKKIGLSVEELERKLSDLREIKPRSSLRTPRDIPQLVESIAVHTPEKAPMLTTLGARFQNKTFLPELKDVKRFFDSHSKSFGKLTSRDKAAPELFRFLSSLDDSELISLCELEETDGSSSLGLISDAIMRRKKV